MTVTHETGTGPSSPSHSQLCTTHQERARQFLSDAFDVELRLSPMPDGPLFRIAHADAGPFALSDLQLPADHRFDSASPDALIVVHVDAGRAERRSEGVDEQFLPGDVFIPSHPESPFDGRTIDAELHILRLGLPLLAEVAGLPADEAKRVRFTGFQPVSRPAADSWNNTLDYITGALLAHKDIVSQPLIPGQAARLLAATALSTFPNTLDPGPDPGPAHPDRERAAPAAVRRAVAFIDENTRNDIGLAHIAAAAHLTPRATQYTFRRHLDTTPLGCLRAARLAEAHRDLAVADPTNGDTVASIATRWGFLHQGRFAALYRNTYGVTPAMTLGT